MHIEIIGSTSAGKTTLAQKMVNAGKKSGVNIDMSDDFMLEQLHLDWVANNFMRRRLVEVVAIWICLKNLATYKDFIVFVFREGKSSPGTWYYRANRIRNVIRKIGIFEFISQRADTHQVVIADNEGLLQGLHNLFVHSNSEADVTKIARYVELIPMPDLVLYLYQDEQVLVSRTLKRGHARIVGSSPEKMAHFIGQAVAVFDELIKIPKIQDRLLVVDGEKVVTNENINSGSINIQQVAGLVSS
jgi:deoxyadenosine/deoxycytidine kinase